VGDILILYDQRKTNTEETLTEFNEQPTIKLTIEKGVHNSISFLDLPIHRKGRELELAIYRKSTERDIIIPSNSCHPYGHKIL
jgi:hypothetical protein